MIQWLLKKVVGSKNERDLKKMWPVVRLIHEEEKRLLSMSDDELKEQTNVLRARLAAGESLDDILPSAFAVVKNACRRLAGKTFDVLGHDRVWVEIPYDVQLIGGMALHNGRIAEMATGEGKTLVATLPVYLNALSGKGVHVVTVNDYLARRDAEWMGILYRWLGLTVGCIQSGMHAEERREQYACDITYGTNSEFGFDYLRDNMATRAEYQVQRGHAFAIVDEIDSILIDEARTPLIISGPAQSSNTEEYVRNRPAVDKLVRRQTELCSKWVKEAEKLLEKEEYEEAAIKMYQVRQGMPKNPQLLALLEEPSVRRILEKVENRFLTDAYKEQARELREELYFTIDEKGHDATLTEKGCETMSPGDPEAYVLPDLTTLMAVLDGREDLTPEKKIEVRQSYQDHFAEKSLTIHAVDQLIRAYCMYERDVQYVVQNNQVIIVDENTGRLMVGRRWGDGLHQAVEAKEGVKIERETQTLATITIQNYFRMYTKLGGMTGTAETEADEFHQIYKLDVLVVPTNRPVRRVDYNDQVYKTRREKEQAAVQQIAECHQRKQPVLVGTVTVESSERLSRLLQQAGIPHNVLNAKNHEREAEIVMRAGQPGAVTIATNMAGRGTDIKLGESVVWVDRELLNGQIALNDKVDGKTLRSMLEEQPCGLYVLATERHDSRRIDRQLRGRCSRQGDPGASRFLVSLEDDLMRLFGSDRISSVMEKLGLEEGQVLESSLLNSSIERAQRRVEQHNFSIRKRTLEYDDVMNKQREVVYGLRSEVLRSEDPREQLLMLVDDAIINEAEVILSEEINDSSATALAEWANTQFPIGIKPEEINAPGATVESVCELLRDRVRNAYAMKAQSEEAEHLRELERQIMLMSIDQHWQEYLRNIDGLRQGIGLVAYGQRDPLVEFKREAYGMFEGLMSEIRGSVALRMFRTATSQQAMEKFFRSIQTKAIHQEVDAMELARRQAAASDAPSANEPPTAPPPPSQASQAVESALSRVTAPARRETPKVGRNDVCPCGSGKKYKKCCGANG